jgi:hypothetical protein
MLPLTSVGLRGRLVCAVVLAVALAASAGWWPRRVIGLDNGVIIPPARMADRQEPIERFWLPTRAQVAEIERQLPAFVAAHGELRSSCRRGHCRQLDDYVRVIWGNVDDGGRRSVFVFLVERSLYEADEAEPARRWDDLLMLQTADGGDAFMGVNYDVARGLLFEFSSHE